MSIARSRLVIAISLFYAVAYSHASIWYLQLTIEPYRSISLIVQLTILFLALSGIAYLFLPILGHPLMILSTIVACACTRANGNIDDAWFFGVVALILVWKFVRKTRSFRLKDNIEIHDTSLLGRS
jgi:hypothetical protein